jgi:hypothetical protein
MIPPERLIIGNISVGQQTYEKPFFLNNDAFPLLSNSVCFRQSVIKKPGSAIIGRLTRNISSVDLTQTTTAGTQTIITDILNDASINVRTSLPNASIQIGSVTISSGSNQWQDNVTPGILTATAGNAVDGTIDYSTGDVVLNFSPGDSGGNTITVTLGYYPDLPVMGIESFEPSVLPSDQIDFPTNVYFDQVYSYQFNGTNFFDVSFYKGTNNPVTWSGANYQQFFSSNYYHAMFVTNNNPGMKFAYVHSASNQSSTTITMVIYDYTHTNPLTTLVNGDNLFFNQGLGTTWTINGQSGTISDASGSGSGTYVITFSTSQTVNTYTTNSAIAQLLTSSASGTGDGIRWYDGFGAGLGWVNFAPPLDTQNSSATTYLMGARMILPFGNRLLAIGTFEDTSANAANPHYYGNRIRYCEVTATPFYSAPVPNGNPATGFNSLAWVSDIQGYGGFIDLDTTQRILSAAVTQGDLILGLEAQQRRMSNTGIEVDPFSLQVINPEYGSAGTFAIIPMDKGILTAGEYGFLTTSSYDSQRFDLKIIDQIFSIEPNNNGYERICGGRDFVNEVVYFTYQSIEANAHNSFPNQTVVYNYRENSFALWNETFTTYGLYKVQSAQTWPNYNIPWEDWNVQWQDLGGNQFEEPFVSGGTPQGFVMQKWSELSFNQPSMWIQSISGTTVTSPNHNLEVGAYVGFWDGLPSDTDALPQFIAQVNDVTSINAFTVDTDISSVVPGIWLMSVIDQINIYSKQFPAAWSSAQKTRIGAQKYFLDKTTLGEFTVNIYGSQSTLDLNNPANSTAIFSNIVRTRPDNDIGTNSGQQYQAQIWHRLASSCIGDTVQLQFTFSDAQMRNIGVACAPWTLYSAVLDLYPSRTLA